MMQTRVIRVPWFVTEEAWQKMRAAAADKAMLPESLAEFETLAGAKFAAAQRQGLAVENVLFDVGDVDALIEWCAAESRPLDGMARAGLVEQLAFAVERGRAVARELNSDALAPNRRLALLRAAESCARTIASLSRDLRLHATPFELVPYEPATK